MDRKKRPYPMCGPPAGQASMMCKYGVERGAGTSPYYQVASEASHIWLFLPLLHFQLTSLHRAQTIPLLFLSHLSTPLWTTLPFIPCRVYFRSHSNHPLGHVVFLLFYVDKAMEMGKLPPFPSFDGADEGTDESREHCSSLLHVLSETLCPWEQSPV